MPLMSQAMPILPSSRISGPYVAGAGQTAFNVGWPFQRATDLLVQIRPNAGETWVEAVLGADYSVAGAGTPAGGTVTFYVGRVGGSQVRVLGKAAIAVEVDPVPAGSFDSQTFARWLDRVAIWLQEASRDIEALNAAAPVEEAQEAASAAAASAAAAAASVASAAAQVALATAQAAAASVSSGDAGTAASAAIAARIAAEAAAASLDTSTLLTKAGNLAGIADGAVARGNIGAAAPLGFTPVRQGGGAGQGAAIIRIGDNSGRAKLQVDASDQGFIWADADAAKTLAASGYQRLPSGLIVQWGAVAAGAATGSITFPTAFPTACLGAWPVIITSDTNLYGVGFNTPSTTGFNFNLRVYNGSVLVGAAAVPWRWLALGY